eukprot:COSAG01_NODE_45928_length_404_cov_81.937705_2_plen_86_part_01
METAGRHRGRASGVQVRVSLHCVSVLARWRALPACALFPAIAQARAHLLPCATLQIIKTCELAAKDCKRDQTMQYLNPKIKFPLPH